MIVYVLAVILTALFLWNCFRTEANLPPKVPGALPLFGHLIALGGFPCEVMLKWKQKYGPVYVVKFGSLRTVILNDAKLAKEAFKNTAVNDRPPLTQFKEGTHDRGLAFVDYNKGEQRQFMLKNLKTFSENGHHLEANLNDEITSFFDVPPISSGQPVSIRNVFTPMILNSIWSIVMGCTFTKNDPQLNMLCGLVQRVTAIPGIMGSVGMWNPWLSRLAPNLTGATSWVEAYKNLCCVLQQKTNERKETRVRGHPRDITDAFVDRVEETNDHTSTFDSSKNFLPNSMAEMLIASMETTSTTLEWLILYLAKYPSPQKRLQDEITDVITKSRLPTLSDRPNMPYTEAVISEVLRISGVVPISLPHYTHVDTQVLGFSIPKDTLLIQNTWGIQHDPDIWVDPDEFRPDRFLDENGRFKKNENLVVFGCGKRVCLGEFVARDQLFIFVTRIFQRFSIHYYGKIPSTRGNHGLVIHPEHFSVVFTE